MKRLISMLLVTALAVSTLVGCSNKDTSVNTLAEINAGDKNTLVVAQSADARGLDPALVDDCESAKAIANIYEGLVKFKEGSNEVEPCLAKSWKISEDGLNYTFYLRKGVKFQDNSDFDADVVKYNVERHTKDRARDTSFAQVVWGPVRKVVVKNSYTVVIKLREATPNFLTNLAMPLGGSIVSSKTCRSKWSNMNIEPCGTGPYQLVRWDKGESLILTRNDEYWGKKAKIKNLVFKVITDNAERAEALKNGQVDIVDDVNSEYIEQLKANGCNVAVQDGMNTNYIAYNTEELKDVDVRTALSQAVNVPELVKNLYGDYAKSATTVVPSVLAPYADKVKAVSYDPKAAKATLQAKGVKEVHMVTYTNARPYNPATGVTLAESLKRYYEQAGLKVTLDTYDWQGYKDKMSNGKFDIACYGWIGDTKQPEEFLSPFASREWYINIARYKRSKFFDLSKQVLVEMDAKNRTAICEDMEKQLAKDAVVLPICNVKKISANSTRVENVVYTNLGVGSLKDVTKS